MSDPIPIPDAVASEQIYVTVKRPNGQHYQIALYTSDSHPARASNLALAVESQYATIFPNWDPVVNPCKVYNVDWKDVEPNEILDPDQVYGVCPSEAPVPDSSAGEGELFDLEM